MRKGETRWEQMRRKSKVIKQKMMTQDDKQTNKRREEKKEREKRMRTRREREREEKREKKKKQETKRKEKEEEKRREEKHLLCQTSIMSPWGDPHKCSCLSHDRLFISFALSEALLRDPPWLMFNEGADTTSNSASVYLRQIPRAPSNWSHNETLLTVKRVENNNHQGRWKKVHKREQQSS